MAEGGYRKPKLWECLLVVAFAAGLISYSVLKLEVDAHIPIASSAVFAALVAKFMVGVPWSELEKGMFYGIYVALQAVMILAIVGMLVGIWIFSGVVPTLIYYGLEILSPSYFLLASLLICSIVSLATGTSWGTTGTVGIALMGVAAGLGVPAPMAAGLIISGAYFGDKMSPLSDTTNLAPAVAGTTLFSHIRAMVWTTGPTYLIVAALALVLGLKYGGGELDVSKIRTIQEMIRAEFFVSPLGFVPPALVITAMAMKMPAIPGLILGIFLGVLLALFKGAGLGDIIGALHYGYKSTLAADISGAADTAALSQILAEKGLGALDPELAKEVGGMLSELLNRGGLDSMMWTISLILLALSFGGIMEKAGFLEVLLENVLKGIKGVGGLVSAVIASCFVSNLFLGDQYLSIVMPGRMFAPVFRKRGLHPRLLSRSLEDSGTLTSVLVPWNTCGAYNSSVLGVPTLQYMPYAFLNYLNPLVAIAMAFMGIGIFYRKEGDADVVEV